MQMWLSDVEARAETERDDSRVSSVELHDDDDDDDAPARSNDMQSLLVGVVGDDDDDDNTVGHLVWSFLILEQRRVVSETNNLHNVVPVLVAGGKYNLCIPVVAVAVVVCRVVVAAVPPTVRQSSSFHIVNAVIAFCNNDALQLLLTRYRCWWNRVVGRCRRSCRSS